MEQRVKTQLYAVNHTLKAEACDLFYNRKFDLHTLNEKAKEADIQDLNMLLGLTLPEPQNDWRKKELRQICITYKINSPLIGEE